MRKFSLIIAAALLLTLAACTVEPEGPAGETRYTVEELAAAILQSQSALPVLYEVKSGEAQYESTASLYLGGLSGSAMEGVVCYPFGVAATEAAVFRFASPEDAESAVNALTGYMKSRAGAFQGYAPEEAELARNGRAVANGVYAAMFICPEPDKAEAAFLASFGEEAPEPAEIDRFITQSPISAPEPPVPTGPSTEGDEYDHDAVLAAWRTGDVSALTAKNRAIYDACIAVIGEIFAADMSDYDKELAINDYLVFHADYDEAEIDHEASTLEPDPDNDNPYGLLINGRSICLGYASTFQLFMDMLDIECVTVRGTAEDGTEDHAWNMVRLDDGEWYCVDVTWNDPVFVGWTPTDEQRLFYARSYFNVTSDYLRATDHQWDETNVPEANGTKYAYRGS